MSDEPDAPEGEEEEPTSPPPGYIPGAEVGVVPEGGVTPEGEEEEEAE